ncbi:MAG: aminotransferase class I/II-fold pyridoxal phosphate-dependent enzyme [Oscillospiraceae bacterium]|nr:aminotransferase class I/II-fold pyridoxal phosphate-dependent enzyme [Oscillospiraceae bacterium]MDE5883887.1 aminotransferase class I/II-fold pyridoxal phosphate-dependent enzyme [Oscillospiraceae bacterium]
MNLSQYNPQELSAFYQECLKAYENYQAQNLKLDMSRGKPSPEQLDLSKDLLTCIQNEDLIGEGGDYRNYGLLDGIPEAKKLFAPMLGVEPDEMFMFGNASLQAMYMVITYAHTHGLLGCTPWKELEHVKFLCPVPGYDRHFKITEFFNIEMINIPTDENGPDMDLVEKLVSEDDSIKGIWCVPQYSNPSGIVYSDEVVTRFAKLQPKAKDFRIFWDNAYCIHHLCDNPKIILPILQEAKKYQNEDLVYIFASTAKVTYAGAGVSMIAASRNNIADITKALTVFTISFDKINQMRHVKYFDGKLENIMAHMEKQRALIEPKFKIVLDTLNAEIRPLGIGEWTEPKGGYFVSFNAMPDCAKRIVELCKNAGVVLTGAGAAFPYGKDPEDRNIRIAPTYPDVTELQQAMDLFVLCVKLASAEKLLKK